MNEEIICDDTIYKKHARDIKEIFDKKKIPTSNYLFEIAFKVPEKFNEWKLRDPKITFKKYMDNLIKFGELKSKADTLKLMSKVSRIFPDLKEASNRRLPFDSYREIANTELSEQQMKDFRKEAEDFKYSGRKIRIKVKQILGEAAREKQTSSAYKKVLIFYDEDRFISDIQSIILNKNPQPGDVFILSKLRA